MKIYNLNLNRFNANKILTNRILIALAIAILTYLIFGSKLKAAAIILALILVASMSTFYYNYMHSPINFELVKFSTIISSLWYGSIIGLAVGITSTTISRLWSGRLDHHTLLSLLGIIPVALGASMINVPNTIIMAIGLVIAYHAITAPISIFLGDRPSFVLTYAMSNTAINAAIFIITRPLTGI